MTHPTSIKSRAKTKRSDASRTTAARSLPAARTVAEEAANALREQIRTGQLEPGAPLRQSEIARQFGVSITPVREAFGMLEREGLVQRTTHRGVVVFRPSIEDLLNRYQIRSALEAAAAASAAQRLDAGDVAALRAILDEMSHTNDDGVYVELNARFHSRIELAARNPRLAELIDTERMATNAYIMFLGVKRASAADTQTEHEAILDALDSHDSDAAAAAMARHLSTRAVELRDRFMRSAGPPLPRE
jgi:DNA-binding GntR family transcriptional regulator